MSFKKDRGRLKTGFQTTFLFMGLIGLEWRYPFKRMQAGSVAL
ncbi:hypothetical protein [Neisseria sicca]|nr:hypothetical protein [Neisseria sicca]